MTDAPLRQRIEAIAEDIAGLGFENQWCLEGYKIGTISRDPDKESNEVFNRLLNLIESEVKQAQLTILDQLRMEHDNEHFTGHLATGYNVAVEAINQRIDKLKAGMEKGEQNV